MCSWLTPTAQKASSFMNHTGVLLRLVVTSTLPCAWTSASHSPADLSRPRCTAPALEGLPQTLSLQGSLILAHRLLVQIHRRLQPATSHRIHLFRDEHTGALWLPSLSSCHRELLQSRSYAVPPTPGIYVNFPPELLVCRLSPGAHMSAA